MLGAAAEVEADAIARPQDSLPPSPHAESQEGFPQRLHEQPPLPGEAAASPLGLIMIAAN